MIMHGMCQLCRRQAELQDSHYMPAALYKLLLKIGTGSIDAPPVYTDEKEQTAFYTSRQWRKHMLCRRCESLFSRNGESHVITNCYRGGNQFQLRDDLNRLDPTEVRSKGLRVYFGEQMPETLKAKAYCYFALSVLWRGSVVKWSTNTEHYYMSIEPEYEQPIRMFLLGDGEFPKNTVVRM
jgi:hypothetical protein